MIAFIIIGIICLIIYLLFIKDRKIAPVHPVIQPEPINIIKEKVQKEAEEIFIDEYGKKYKNIIKEREIPRRTYLSGKLNGKYWGEQDIVKEQEYEHCKFYDFNIYEIEISETADAPVPFDFPLDSTFPRNRLPSLLPVTLKRDGKEYALNIYEPQVAKVIFNRKLHQDEGKEVFGTINADFTGYVLDFVKEQYTVRKYLDELQAPRKKEAVIHNPVIIKTGLVTGNMEYNINYTRTEYYYGDYKTRYWGDWKYTKPIGATRQEGCLSSGLGLIGTIIGVIFLLLLVPRLAIILPFFLIPLLFNIIPEVAWNWLLRIIGLLLIAAVVFSIVNSIRHAATTYIPKPHLQETAEERKSDNIDIVDSTSKKAIDTLITHYRNWKDYNGNNYEGRFWVKESDLRNSSSYKNNLIIPENTENNYDKIVYLIKENDNENLNGIYQLFDSIKNANKSDAKTFAEIIVSFVQDIPYTVVLPEACDPNLYADNFIKKYLISPDARCDGYQKFGINSPVEFMANLQGDCDTRTLLIYTILSHYNYDVTLMSSEFYNHSLIGINLPYDGVAYDYNNQRYVLWETTSPNIKPGIIANEISNINYWRISLKSK